MALRQHFKADCLIQDVLVTIINTQMDVTYWLMLRPELKNWLYATSHCTSASELETRFWEKNKVERKSC